VSKKKERKKIQTEFLQNLAFRFFFLLIFLVFYVLRGERHKKVTKIQIYPYF